MCVAVDGGMEGCELFVVVKAAVFAVAVVKVELKGEVRRQRRPGAMNKGRRRGPVSFVLGSLKVG